MKFFILTLSGLLISISSMAQERITFQADRWDLPNTYSYPPQLKTSNSLISADTQNTLEIVVESASLSTLKNLQSVEVFVEAPHNQSSMVTKRTRLTFSNAIISGSTLTAQLDLQNRGQALLQEESNLLNGICQAANERAELLIRLNHDEAIANYGKVEAYTIIIPISCE